MVFEVSKSMEYFTVSVLDGINRDIRTLVKHFHNEGEHDLGAMLKEVIIFLENELSYAKIYHPFPPMFSYARKCIKEYKRLILSMRYKLKEVTNEQI